MIEAVIDQISKAYTSAFGDNLLGFRVDADEFIGRAKWADQITFQTQNDPKCVIKINVTLLDDIESLQRLAFDMKIIWNIIGYNDFEATSIKRYRTATILRFVTLIECAYCITGRIRASDGPYSRLAEDFEARFRELPDEPMEG